MLHKQLLNILIQEDNYYIGIHTLIILITFKTCNTSISYLFSCCIICHLVVSNFFIFNLSSYCSFVFLAKLFRVFL